MARQAYSEQEMNGPNSEYNNIRLEYITEK
jgi:hypothetical protein